MQEDSRVEQPAEEPLHPRFRRLVDVAVAPKRPIGEEEPEEGALAGRLAGHAGGAECLPETHPQPRAERVQPVELRTPR